LEEDILARTGLAREDLVYLKAGDVLDFGNLRLEVLFPEGKDDAAYRRELSVGDENPRSLVVRVCFAKGEILMTGDLDTKTEDALLALAERRGQSPEADILKISHHGSPSGTGEGFLEAVRPSVAVISVGRNNYGHPAASVLEKCRKNGIMIFRTDRQGAIGVAGLSRGTGLEVLCMKEP
jgi:competence protein ComEC